MESQHQTLNKGKLQREVAFTQGFLLAKDNNLVLEKKQWAWSIDN